MSEITGQDLDSVKIADIVVTAIVGIVGIYLVHSYQRQQALRVAEKRWQVSLRSGARCALPARSSWPTGLPSR